MAWLWWLVVAFVFLLIELLSLDLFLLMFFGGALAAAMAAGLGADLWIQIVAFIVVSVLLIFSLRPWLLKNLRQRQQLVETNVHALVNQKAVTLGEVSVLGGRVKLRGEVWSARSGHPDWEFKEGQKVVVLKIDGATAVIGPKKISDVIGDAPIV